MDTKMNNNQYEGEWAEYFTVQVKPTLLCNLKCNYCYQKNDIPELGNKNMPDSILNKIYEAISKIPCTVSVQWIGGETILPGLPFFEKVNELTIKYSSDRHRIVNEIQTNLTLFDDKWVKFYIKNNDRFKLSVSYDTFEESFLNIQLGNTDKNRRYFQLIENNLDNIIAFKIPVGALVTITNNSLQLTPSKWIEKWIKKGLRNVGLQLDYSQVFSSMSNGHWQEYILFLEEMFLKQLEYNSKNPEDRLFLRESFYLFNKMDDTILMDLKTTCHSNSMLCSNYLSTIDTNGNIYATCDAFTGKQIPKYNNFIVGNILNDDFFSVRKNNTFHKIQDDFFQIRTECTDCEVYKYCRGGCSLFKTKKNKMNSFSRESNYCNYMINYYKFIIDPIWREKIKNIYT